MARAFLLGLVAVVLAAGCGGTGPPTSGPSAVDVFDKDKAKDTRRGPRVN